VLRWLKRILVSVLSIYFALVVYIYAGQKSLIFRPVGEGTLTPKDFSLTYEDLSFPSFDKVSLHGWFIPKTDYQTTQEKRSLVYCHGNAGSLSSLANVTKIFNNYGFETLFFTYRSYGSSDQGELAELNVIGDAVAAYDLLKQKRPNQKIYAWGHSLGASVCAGLSLQRPLNGLILEAPFYSIPSMAGYKYPWAPVFPSLMFDQFPTGYFVQHRLNRTPLLLMHSRKDTIIPFTEGEKVFQTASEPKHFKELQNIDHNDFPDISEQYKPIILKWVDDSEKKFFDDKSK
jgi:alpha-beta hydrolase superfamily lysophospholipase